MTERSEPKRRQRRPAVSCSLCRRRKIRCNQETPCSNCVRSGNDACVYEKYPSQPPRQHLGQDRTTEFGRVPKPGEPVLTTRASHTSKESTPSSHPSSTITCSTSASTLNSQQSTWDVESLKSRIRQLEEQVSRATSVSTQSPELTSYSDLTGGTFHVHRESRFGAAQAISRSITYKNRRFGQSHWSTGLFKLLGDILGMTEPLVRDVTSKAFTGIQKCKSLARVIKSRRTPPWPLPPNPDLPPKDVADKLVDCYLRTSEAIYRILHVPTFRRDYERLWVSDTEPNIGFLVQLKLVLAIGATTYDEKFSLRASAIRWVYEAQAWVSEPEFKSRLSFHSLQTNLLLLLAREAAGVGGTLIWIDTGALFKTAVYMGLHRDPACLPKRTNFAAEMHRRLWNTLLEITLQSSMNSGGPPFLSLDDFDTEPPGNYDDEQLLAEDAAPKSEDNFTEVSIAIALRKTFPLRLAITKLLNDLSSQGSYEETLRLDGELRASYKALCRNLQGCNSSTGPSPSRFEISVLDFIIHRYISALHVPFFGLALHETTYAFSRKVVVETSLKIWFAVCPSSSIMAAQSRADKSSSDQDNLGRLALCGSGFYNTIGFQAANLIAMELRVQLQEEESLGPVPLRPDLLSVLEDVKPWCLRRIETGETNMKGYLLSSIVAAQIEGLIRGLGKDEMPKLLVKAAEDAAERCLILFEETLGQDQAEGSVDGLNQMSSYPPLELIEDWDFMVSDAMFNPGNGDSMNWMFNIEPQQGPSIW